MFVLNTVQLVTLGYSMQTNCNRLKKKDKNLPVWPVKAFLNTRPVTILHPVISLKYWRANLPTSTWMDKHLWALAVWDQLTLRKKERKTIVYWKCRNKDMIRGCKNDAHLHLFLFQWHLSNFGDDSKLNQHKGKFFYVKNWKAFSPYVGFLCTW